MKSLLVIAMLTLSACATRPVAMTPTGLASPTDLPPTSPVLDHYVAWIPVEQAQTASVAEAMTHISLQHARTRLRDEVCRGNTVTRRMMVERHGPVATRAPASMGGQPAWYYRVSHQPGLAGCDSLAAGDLYPALQERLPAWISVSPGRPVARQTASLGRDR